MDGRTLLGALHDIDGVLGGFLIDPQGRVLAQDVPRLFADTLARAAEHLSRLRAALELQGAPLTQCLARFGEHLILMRSAGAVTLCVLCPQSTSLPALQMGCTLALRRLADEPRASPANAPRALQATKESLDSDARRFRGRAL